LIIAGYATAVLLPIIGLILGIALLVRRETGHGLAIIAISLVALVAGVLLWLTPLLISAYVTALIGVLAVPVAFVARRRGGPQSSGTAPSGTKWIALALLIAVAVGSYLLLDETGDQSGSRADRISDQIERGAERLQDCLTRHNFHFRACRHLDEER
jgi:hypothetical protein